MAARVRARVRLLGARSIVAAARMGHRRLVGRRFTRRCSSLLARNRIATHTMMLLVLLHVLLQIIRLPFAHPHLGNIVYTFMHTTFID